MIWLVYPDEENSDYDMYDGAVVKANTKEEAEKIATKELNYFWFGTSVEYTKQIWTAELLNVDEVKSGVVFTSYNAG